MNLRAFSNFFVAVSGALLASTLPAAADQLGHPVARPPEVIESDVDRGEVESPPHFDLESEQGQAMIDEFADVHGLSSTEGRRVFQDSVPITGFLEAHRADPRFGALWVTYENGYEIHVRYVADDFLPAVRRLEKAVDRSVATHRGGASARDLADAEEFLKREGILYEPDNAAGSLRVFGDTLPTAAGVRQSALERFAGISVEPGPAPRYETVDTSRSGADVWRYSSISGWSRVCTAAAMWQGTGPWSGMTGYLWAAHCPNLVPDYTFADGGYSHGSFPTMHTICGPQGDWELIRFSAPKNEHETFLDKRYNPPVETTFRIAGGYYVGQPSFKVGLSTNGTTGTNMGSVAGYATSEVGVACEAVRPHLRYWHSDAGGDSGGPVFLFYNGEWYLGAVHNGYESSFGGFRYGSAIWDISVPFGHLCSLDWPCT